MRRQTSPRFDSEETRIVQLEQEYLPLDPALVRAILSDYSASDPKQLKTVREHLDTLRAFAISEDAELFDPSGTSWHDTVSGVSVEEGAAGEKGSNHSTLSMSGETEVSSISNELLGLTDNSVSEIDTPNNSDEVFDELSKLDTNSKIARLSEIFPTEKRRDISYTLQKCNGDFTQAMDILLNHVFFHSELQPQGYAIPTKSIDAFAEEHVVPRVRQKKGKARKYHGLEDYGRSDSIASVLSGNKWESGNKDIAFIASRTKIPKATISSLYHQNGASTRKTIMVLIEQKMDGMMDKASEDFIVDEEAARLSEEFPSLLFEHCAALVSLTYPSTADAHELAKTLTSPPDGVSRLDRIVPQYTPVKISDTSISAPSSSQSASFVFGDSASLSSARSVAFTKASQHYRRGKSDHLMGGAAAYYSSLGREYSTALKAATAAEADALVLEQSTPSELDLHGVSVKDATRIATEKARSWWHGLGENRIGDGSKASIGEGYRIITGMGRHSGGGVGKLGPAVMKALLRDGWRIEVGSGVLTVIGRMKR